MSTPFVDLSNTAWENKQSEANVVVMNKTATSTVICSHTTLGSLTSIRPHGIHWLANSFCALAKNNINLEKNESFLLRNKRLPRNSKDQNIKWKYFRILNFFKGKLFIFEAYLGSVIPLKKVSWIKDVSHVGSNHERKTFYFFLLSTFFKFQSNLSIHYIISTCTHNHIHTYKRTRTLWFVCIMNKIVFLKFFVHFYRLYCTQQKLSITLKLISYTILFYR